MCGFDFFSTGTLCICPQNDLVLLESIRNLKLFLSFSGQILGVPELNKSNPQKIYASELVALRLYGRDLERSRERIVGGVMIESRMLLSFGRSPLLGKFDCFSKLLEDPF